MEVAMTHSIRKSLARLCRTGVLVVACAALGPVLAQGVDKHVPARQKASRPPLTAVSVLPAQHAAVPLNPPKSDPRKIIFVGGAGGKSSLNPQPIPPGDPAGNPPK
jgi:hypothetical protein